MIPSGPSRPARQRLLLALLGLVALVVLGNTPAGTRVNDALFDLAHVPVFGVMALILRRFTAEGPAARKDVLALGGVLAIGVLTEAAQAFQPDRSASVADLLRDVAAGAAFLLLRAFRDRRRTPLVIAATLLLSACFAELGVVLAREVHRAREMPVLARFDGSWWERDLVEPGANALTWPASPPDAVAPAGGALARLDLKPATYSGLSINEPYADWRRYERLVLTIVSDLNEPLPLALRIHDAAHDNRYRDRYNTRFLVSRGENRLAVSLDEVRRSLDSREMDMSRIRGVIVFVHQLEHPTHLYLGEMRLE